MVKEQEGQVVTKGVKSNGYVHILFATHLNFLNFLQKNSPPLKKKQDKGKEGKGRERIKNKNRDSGEG